MPSRLMMLAALLLAASAAPVEDGLADIPTGEPSGEEEVWPSDLLSDSPVWHSVLGATKRHQKEFEDEFQNEVNYHILDTYRISSLPAKCPHFNFSKEACLHRLAQGLLVYTFLLRQVETEFPSSSICSEARYYSSLLINLTKEKMRNPEKVLSLNSSQEAQLLQDLDHPDNAFQRKMTAHSILRQLHNFLLDCKRAIAKREKARGSSANRSTSPIGFFNQKLGDESVKNQL